MPAAKHVCASMLVLLGLAFATRSAGAQITQTYRSLEAWIAEANDVVLGPIAKLTRTVIVEPGGKRADGVVLPDGRVPWIPGTTRSSRANLASNTCAIAPSSSSISTAWPCTPLLRSSRARGRVCSRARFYLAIKERII